MKKTETNFAELSGDKLTVEQELLVPRGAGTVQGQREGLAMKTIYEKMMLLVMSRINKTMIFLKRSA